MPVILGEEVGYSICFEDVTRQKTEDHLTKKFCHFVMIEKNRAIARHFLGHSSSYGHCSAIAEPAAWHFSSSRETLIERASSTPDGALKAGSGIACSIAAVASSPAVAASFISQIPAPQAEVMQSHFPIHLQHWQHDLTLKATLWNVCFTRDP